MKMNRFMHIGFLAAAIVAAPFGPHAQTPDSSSSLPHLEAVDMGQYPSVIEFKGNAVGGPPDAKFVLRCGYSASAGQVAPDPTTNDLSLSSMESYTRYQFIDGKPLITVLDPASHPSNDTREVKVQVTEPDGTMKAKECIQVTKTDTLQSCTATAPFLDGQQVSAMMQALQGECGQFMGKIGSQIDPSVFNAAKTKIWKANLTRLLATVEQ